MVRVWICCNYGGVGDGCNDADDPCGDDCGWREYPNLDAALECCILHCNWCEAVVGDDDGHPGKVPVALDHGRTYCSKACLRQQRSWWARMARAKRDLGRCAQAAGLPPDRCKGAGLSGHPTRPTLQASYPWGSATLVLGARDHRISTCLRDWSACTGQPAPPSRTYAPALPGRAWRANEWNPDDPPGAMSQKEWEAMLRAWLTPDVYGADLAAWDAAQDKLGLCARWALKGAGPCTAT